VGDTGLELSAKTSGESDKARRSLAPTIANSALDRDLAEVVKAWPSLVPEVRQRILAAVRAAPSDRGGLVE